MTGVAGELGLHVAASVEKILEGDADAVAICTSADRAITARGAPDPDRRGGSMTIYLTAGDRTRA